MPRSPVRKAIRPGGTCRHCPTYTESVSVGIGGAVDALSASLSQFTDWRLMNGQWHKAQVLVVPIQYGSSG